MVRITGSSDPQMLRETTTLEAPKKWSLATKILLGAVAIPLIYVAAIKANDLFTYWQNTQITPGNCRIGETVDGVLRDSSFFGKAAKSGRATDQFCLAKFLEAKNTTGSLIEARTWYKSAVDQGLLKTVHHLCKPILFPEQPPPFHLYSEFKSICCPPPPCDSLCAPKTCPWLISLLKDL